MIELYCRTYTTPYPSGEWHDEALYVGENSEEAQAAFEAHEWKENEVGIWVENYRPQRVAFDHQYRYTQDASGYTLP